MDGYGTDEKISSETVVILNNPIRGNSIYTLVDAQSWTNAEDNANKVGGHLITINNNEEYQWGKLNLWGDGLHEKILIRNSRRSKLLLHRI